MSSFAGYQFWKEKREKEETKKIVHYTILVLYSRVRNEII
jgi:hypothetical protein